MISKKLIIYVHLNSITVPMKEMKRVVFWLFQILWKAKQKSDCENYVILFLQTGMSPKTTTMEW